MPFLVVPILAQALSGSVGDRTEVLLRASDGEQLRWDVATAGQVSLRLQAPRTEWVLAYSPVLTELSLGEEENSLLVSHNASLVGALQLSPRTAVQFTESMSYGEMNFRAASLARSQAIVSDAPAAETGDGPPVEAGANEPPQSSQTGTVEQTVRYGSAATGAEFSHRFSPRWRGTVSGGYSVNGGLSEQSRRQIPWTKAVDGAGSLGYSVTRSDEIIISSSGNRTVTDPNTTAIIASGEVAYSHRFNVASIGALSAGEAYARWRGPDGARSMALLPALAATYGYTVGSDRSGRLLLTAQQRYGPVVDRLDGTVDQRLFSSLGVTWARGELTLACSGSAVVSDGTVQNSSMTALNAEESIQYQPDEHWVFEAGVREAWQGYGVLTDFPLLWAAFAAVSYSTGYIPF